MKKIDYNTYTKPTDFARFPLGDSVIRILSSGGMVKKHGMRTGTGYVPLGDCTEEADCEYCLKGNEPKQKWTWICLMRATKEVKILDVGPMLGDAICQIAQARKQDPQEFDLIINKAGSGLKTKYTVRPGEIKPLTEQEQKEIKAMKLFLIKKYFGGM